MRAARSWVPHCENEGWIHRDDAAASLTMSDPHAAGERGQSIGVKDIPDHAIRLALVEASLRPASDDTTRILASMLEKREALANLCCCIDARIVQEEA